MFLFVGFEWLKFNISPVSYGLATGGDSLVGLNDDRIAYNIGIGRKQNDEWSAVVSSGCESLLGNVCQRGVPGTPSCTANLGPTDGSKSIGLGGFL